MIDFPNNPTLNQIYMYNGRTWQWNGKGWIPFSTSSPGAYIPLPTEGTNGQVLTTNGAGVYTWEDAASEVSDLAEAISIDNEIVSGEGDLARFGSYNNSYRGIYSSIVSGQNSWSGNIGISNSNSGIQIDSTYIFDDNGPSEEGYNARIRVSDGEFSVETVGMGAAAGTISALKMRESLFGFYATNNGNEHFLLHTTNPLTQERQITWADFNIDFSGGSLTEVLTRTANGAEWQPAPSGGDILSDGSVPFTAPQEGVDPVDPQDLVTKSFMENILSPVDTCTPLVWDPTEYTGERMFVNKIETDGNGTWIVTVEGYQAGSGGTPPGENQILRSTDDGDTWTAVLDNTNNIHPWDAVATDKAGLWIAFSNNSNHKLTSTDNGATWTVSSTNVQVAQVVYADTSTFVALVAGDMHRSTDNGTTFTNTTPGSSFTGQHTLSSDGNGNVLAHGNLQAFKSTNGGLTWSDVKNTINSAGDLHEVKIGNGGNWVGIVDLGYSGTDVIYSNDNGNSWSSANTLPAVSGGSNNTLISGNGSTWYSYDGSSTPSIYISTDGGVNWSNTGAQTVYAEAPGAASDNGTVIINNSLSQGGGYPNILIGEYLIYRECPTLVGYVKSDPTGIVGATAINNIVKISQADYDNIVSPDPNTYYIIT